MDGIKTVYLAKHPIKMQRNSIMSDILYSGVGYLKHEADIITPE